MNISRALSWSKWKVLRESTGQLSRHTKISSQEIRQTYIDFFVHQHGHEFVPSSSIVPPRDQGTYFTNAGMNQFKPIFLGTVPLGSEMSRYRRVTNSQKCVRVGGKHNDLDDVGHDLTHHTFFEMMGNWAFSDYFKSEACSMALTLLTEVYRIPLERLYVTYFGGSAALGLLPDTDTRDVWLELGVPAKHILPFGMKDNFWDMGATGPCGPSTEIHYDHCGDRDAASLVNTDSPDVIELWNLVFMQFDRQRDESLTALPRQHVDTGLGLERLCAVLQGTGPSNYNTDLFTPLFQAIHKASRVPPYRGRTGEADLGKVDTAYRIVADHARMFTVAIGDGLLPGTEHLEHKLRQIMYRCIHQAHSVLQLPLAFLSTLVDVVEESLGKAYPEISRNAGKIKEIVSLTEGKYLEGMAHGRKTFDKFLRTSSVTNHISGYDVLALYEGRHGYPLSLELISNLAEERGITLDLLELERRQQEDKEMSYRATIQNRKLPRVQLDQNALQSLKVMGIPETDDSWKYVFEKVNGEYNFSFSGISKISALLRDGKFVESVSVGEECGVILDRTNFYSESGGQVADKGEIISQGGELRVTDVNRYQSYVLHTAVVTSGKLQVGDTSSLKINQSHRESCMRNHTATHLVNFALRHTLGHFGIRQSGSLVSPDKLTFDFTYLGKIDNCQIEEMESLVREIVQQNRAVHKETMSLSEASALPGVVKLEGEIYPSVVTVVSVQGANGTAKNSSVELCGGVHVNETGDLAEFCVTRLSSVGLGTKRLTAVTGHQASQAIDNGNKAEEAYNRLERAVMSRANLEKWAVWEKSLYKLLGEDLLQKHRRDDIEDKLRRLGEKISFICNKSSKTVKRQEFIHELEKQSMSDYVIHETAPDINLKEMVKCIQSSSVSGKAVAVLMRKESQLTCLVSVPQEFKVPVEVICETIVQQFGGRRILVKGKNCDGFHAVILNPTESTKQVSTFVKDLFSKISNKNDKQIHVRP